MTQSNSKEGNGRYVVIRCSILNVSPQDALEVEQALRDATAELENVNIEVTMSNARDISGPPRG